MNSAFNFAEPMALWLLLILPLWWWRRKSKSGGEASARWRKYADAHLLPYLMMGEEKGENKQKRGGKIKPLLQTLAWALLVVALAGPRWEFTRSDFFQPDACVMVVLDISRSMLADDIAPNRMARARDAVSDLLTKAHENGTRVGLIAYAATPYIISPLSSDVDIMKQLLPSVAPDIAGLQGSDPVGALDLAARQLHQQTEALGLNNINIYLITDGDLEESKKALEEWAEKNKSSKNPIKIHSLLVATDNGAPVPDDGGYAQSGNGVAHISKPDAALIKGITDGVFARAEGASNGTDKLMTVIGNYSAANKKAGESEMLVWQERFLPFLLAGMLFVLARFPGLLLIMIMIPSISYAGDVPLRKELGGLIDFKNGKYDEAGEKLHDPYHRGVALYRAGKYDEAIKSFSEDSGNASVYDLGNSYFQQQDYQGAIESYRKVLEKEPNNADAEYNLKLAEEMLKNKRGGSGKNQQQNKGGQGQGNGEQQQQGEQQKQNSQGQGQGQGKENKGQQNDGQQNDSKGNEKSEKQQQQSKSDAELERMLREIQGDPGELLKKRIEQQDQQTIRKKYVPKLSPW